MQLSLIRLLGYDIIRSDRKKSSGGVCFYVRSSIILLRNDLCDQVLEITTLEIRKPNSRPFIDIKWYRPPKISVACFDNFNQIIQPAENQSDEIYILGDLNCNLMSNILEAHTNCLNNLLDVYQFCQLITKPTRITSTSKSLIDLFITNNNNRIIKSGVYSYPLVIIL